jgi:hypothetical protein
VKGRDQIGGELAQDDRGISLPTTSERHARPLRAEGPKSGPACSEHLRAAWTALPPVRLANAVVNCP